MEVDFKSEQYRSQRDNLVSLCKYFSVHQPGKQ